jgi:CRISPR-associated protein Cas7/Cst2/DevR subtype I-B
MKGVSITHLTHGQLGNHNAGEGGGNVSTLKRYAGRPYISGQSYRHAIRSAYRSLVDEGFRCVPKHACGNIEQCKSCDLFGYMRPDTDLDYPKRMSPISVTPLLGQYDADVVADLILQYGVDTADNDLAHREMAENVYRGSLTIDTEAIGRREIQEIDSSADDGHEYSRRFEERIDNVDREGRIRETLTAIQHAVKFAGQSRHMADFMPDLVALAVQDTHTHRLANALHVDPETGGLDIDALGNTLRDVSNLGGDVHVGLSHNPVVIQNWGEVADLFESMDDVTFHDTVTDAFDGVRASINVNELRDG